MATYKIILEVGCDPTETKDGVRINNPVSWNYSTLLSTGGYNVYASLQDGYEMCCDSYIDWCESGEYDRYPEVWSDYLHDQGCVHAVIEDEDLDDEANIAFLH